MLWLIIGDSSHQIISCNIHFDNGKYELWVTRVGGKSMKINENVEKEPIQEIKDAIDYAIEIKDPTLRLE